MNPGQFRFIAFASILALMFSLESIWPVRRWETPRAKRLLFHGTVSVFNTALTRLLIVAPLFAWLLFVEERGWGLSHILGLRGIPELIATFILFDGFDYWWHRFNHAVPFLWRFHRVHHVDTHVDVTTALRFHPGELLLSAFAKAVWIGVWGPSLWGFVLAEAGITAYSQFHHANIDFANKWEQMLRWIHMTPRLHASHHTVTTRTRNGNYSTIFLIWDRIFWTLKEPDFEEMRQLGLAEGRQTYLSPSAFLNAPFGDLT